MEEDINDSQDVKSLLDQLKDTTKMAREVQRKPFTLEKKDLEQFVLNNTGKLIQDSMETIDSIKDFIISAPEPEDVHSLAELYKASTGAIEALNKILIQQQRAEAQITVKTMDIQSKQALANTREDKGTFTREEIMEQLFNSGDLIDADAEIKDVD
jgi:hypothetical protein